MIAVTLDAYPQARPGWMPVGRALTVDDLDHSPDDGRRYELVDGVLVVSPGPAFWHQRAGFRLAMLLEAACPEGLVVVPAPFDWRISDSTVVEPDILVAHLADAMAVGGQRYLSVAPVLAVEVLSPSTRRFDRTVKMTTYAAAGAISYWLVDPDPDQPSVTTYRLAADDSYEAGPTASGVETLRVSEPYELSFRPSDLFTGLR